MNNPLKYPAGEFTQAELAVANGMEKIDVYLPMKEAVGKGILIKTGTRPQSSGRGKPSNLYQVADPNAPVPVPAPLPTQTIVETPPIQSTPYIETSPVTLVPQTIIEVIPVAVN